MRCWKPLKKLEDFGLSENLAITEWCHSLTSMFLRKGCYLIFFLRNIATVSQVDRVQNYSISKLKIHKFQSYKLYEFNLDNFYKLGGLYACWITDSSHDEIQIKLYSFSITTAIRTSLTRTVQSTTPLTLKYPTTSKTTPPTTISSTASSSNTLSQRWLTETHIGNCI